MIKLALDYCLLVFFATCGVLQLAATHSHLRGLFIFPNRLLSFLFGLSLILSSFVWFLVEEERNLPDTHGGLNGNEQAGLFALAAIFGILVTFIATSILNRNMRITDGMSESGLGALKHSSFLNAFMASLRRIWKRF